MLLSRTINTFAKAQARCVPITLYNDISRDYSLKYVKTFDRKYNYLKKLKPRVREIRDVREHNSKIIDNERFSVKTDTKEKYLKGLTDRRGKPVLNYYKFKNFRQFVYPAIESNPPVTTKINKYPNWKPLSYEEAEKRLPYKHFLQEEDFDAANASPLVKQSFSWDTASEHELNQKQKHIQIIRFQKFKGDTGSTPVQIAVLTEKIKIMQAHLEKYHKDKPTRRKLGIVLTKRKKLLKYLMRKNPEEYYLTMKALNLPLETMYICSN